MLLEPNPRAAIADVAALNAPEAHAGVSPPSKSCINSASCPFTVALSEGVAVAACISSVYLDAFSALATGSTSSPFKISRLVSLFNITDSPCAASISLTAVVFGSWVAATACESLLTVPVKVSISFNFFSLSVNVFVASYVLAVNASGASACAAAGGRSPPLVISSLPLRGTAICSAVPVALPAVSAILVPDASESILATLAFSIIDSGSVSAEIDFFAIWFCIAFTTVADSVLIFSCWIVILLFASSISFWYCSFCLAVDFGSLSFLVEVSSLPWSTIISFFLSDNWFCKAVFILSLYASPTLPPSA